MILDVKLIVVIIEKLKNGNIFNMRLYFINRDLDFTDENVIKVFTEILSNYPTCNKLKITLVRNRKTYTSNVEYIFIHKETNKVLYTERVHYIDLFSDSLTDILNELNKERKFICKYFTQIRYINVVNYNYKSYKEFNKKLTIKFISFYQNEFKADINGEIYIFSSRYNKLFKKEQLAYKTCDKFWIEEDDPHSDKTWKKRNLLSMPNFPNVLIPYIPELIYLLNTNASKI